VSDFHRGLVIQFWPQFKALNSGYVYIHNFCFNRTGILSIDESECSVYMNAKTSDWVGACLYVTQAANRNKYTKMKMSFSLFAHNNHSLSQFISSLFVLNSRLKGHIAG